MMSQVARVLDAHLPTWFKIQLAEASRAKRSYLDVGFHLGHYHPDQFDLDEAELAAVTEADLMHPTATLRRLFASEEHPEAGLVDYIPTKRRGAVLRGLVYAARGLERQDILDSERAFRG
jgi:hypothetical protein